MEKLDMQQAQDLLLKHTVEHIGRLARHLVVSQQPPVKCSACGGVRHEDWRKARAVKLLEGALTRLKRAQALLAGAGEIDDEPHA